MIVYFYSCIVSHILPLCIKLLWPSGHVYVVKFPFAIIYKHCIMIKVKSQTFMILNLNQKYTKSMCRLCVDKYFGLKGGLRKPSNTYNKRLIIKLVSFLID